MRKMKRNKHGYYRTTTTKNYQCFARNDGWETVTSPEFNTNTLDMMTWYKLDLPVRYKDWWYWRERK